jgi:hypothetical protein
MIFTENSIALKLSYLAAATMIFAVLEARADTDVFLTNVGGHVTIGGANDPESATPFYELDTKVFEGILVTGYPIPIFDFGRGEPGFIALPAGSPQFPAGTAALAGNAAVTVHFPTLTIGGQSDSLFYWNGSGPIDFQPIGTSQPGVTLTVDPNPLSDLTSGDGFLHFHPAFELDNGGPGRPADGVYVATPTVGVAGMAESEPFYLVLLANQFLVDDDAAEGLTETFENGGTFYAEVGKDFAFYREAVAYVQTNIADPEPAALLLTAVAAVAFAMCSPRLGAR